MINCPNCGVPIEPYKCKCDYCGSSYFDLSWFDASGQKPQYVKFKTIINGKEAYLTALTKLTSLDCEIRNNTIEARAFSGDHLISPIVSHQEADLTICLSCLEDNDHLFQINIEEDKK